MRLLVHAVQQAYAYQDQELSLQLPQRGLHSTLTLVHAPVDNANWGILIKPLTCCFQHAHAPLLIRLPRHVPQQQGAIALAARCRQGANEGQVVVAAVAGGHRCVCALVRELNV